MKNNILKKAVSFLLTIMLTFVSSLLCMADGVFECDITYNSDEISVNLSGASGSTVTVYVYDGTTTPGEFSHINIPRALWQHNIKRYSQFDFDVKLSDDLPNGEYIVVASDGSSKITYSFTHLNPDTAANAIKAINTAALNGATAVEQALKDNASLLMIDEKELEGYVDVASGIISGRELQFEKYTELFDVIEECKVISIIVNAKDDEVIDLVIQNVAPLGVNIEVYYDALSDKAKTFVANNISDDHTYQTESFSVGFSRLSALAKIACASKWQDIRDAITDTHKDVIDIKTSGVSNLDKIFREMMNCTYSEFDDIKENFDKCKKSVNSSSSSTKGGGASTGGGVPVIGNTSGQNDSKAEQKPEVSTKLVFADIADDHWAKNSIYKLVQLNILSGYPDNTFRPANHITRAEFVKLIVTAFAIDGESRLNFEDVASGAWHMPFIQKAYAAGIIAGVSDKYFAPDANITRQDASLIIYRIIKDKLNGGKNLEFNDADQISDYAFDAVNALSAEGIINGVGNGNFAPKAHIDRQSAAVLIDNCINRVGLK